MDLYPFARPLLFAIDPERAHELTLSQIDRAAACGAMRLVAGTPVSDPVQVMGLRFANRVGLAAGLDKNAAHLSALQTMGFGFIEVGTVTPRAQPGNPRPRMFRLPERRALINRLGFNNEGVDTFLANVTRSRYRGVLGLNIGKNADTPIERALDDFRLCLQRVYPHASYVTVNVSSPNTKNLRQLQGGDDLERMLEGLASTREHLAVEHQRRVPIALKIAPDLDETQIDTLAAALPRHGFDAVIATNTTLSREAVSGLPHADEAGGLSGAPVLAASNRVIAGLRARLPAGFPIIGVGGVMSGEDARSKIDAGATLVQLYTGLIYRGPALVRECALALARQAARS
ncbi:MAG TPA: quinone-dependent dihydroorotate dehydrogenase [Burkholderiaceae bacterium]|jgi:dihydroorotate dehydrogenase|nr:quinone-dependent dihydroorotate dehydrogenase [Burkholderiaceae bacterium]